MLVATLVNAGTKVFIECSAHVRIATPKIFKLYLQGHIELQERDASERHYWDFGLHRNHIDIHLHYPRFTKMTLTRLLGIEQKLPTEPT